MESDFLFFSDFGASSCENWGSAKSFKDVSECQTMSIEQGSHVLSPLLQPSHIPSVFVDSQRIVVDESGDVHLGFPCWISSNMLLLSKGILSCILPATYWVCGFKAVE